MKLNTPPFLGLADVVPLRERPLVAVEMVLGVGGMGI